MQKTVISHGYNTTIEVQNVYLDLSMRSCGALLTMLETVPIYSNTLSFSLQKINYFNIYFYS
jgi:hypothetical protein